ncbi:MAG: hypothetical protein WBL00_09520 [Bacteroidales bacterium]
MGGELIGAITTRTWSSFNEWRRLSPGERCGSLEAMAGLLNRNN